MASAYNYRACDDVRSQVLLAVVAVDLVFEARGATSLQWIVAGLLCGADSVMPHRFIKAGSYGSKFHFTRFQRTGEANE